MRSSEMLWDVFLAWLVTAPVSSLFFENSLLTDMYDWYKRNGVYKFGVGDVICPSYTPGVGYGIDPEGLVVEHTVDGKYIVMMTTSHQSTDGSWTRSTSVERHFKWNIEHHFRMRHKRRSGVTAASM